MKKYLTCIVCPMGCELEVEVDGEKVVSVQGNNCVRGRDYAHTECTDPRRVITTTVKTKDGRIISVKTDKAVPKNMIFECMDFINALRPECSNGCNVGDVLCENILGTGASLVACSKIQRM